MAEFYTIQDRFRHELNELNSIEHNAVQMLPKLANETGDAQLKTILQQFEHGTRQHLQNLGKCFQSISAQPEQVTGTTVLGLQQEHAMLSAGKPTQNEVTLFGLHAAAKIAAYEVSAYHALIDKAHLMGKNDCVQVLQQDLQHVESTAQNVNQLRTTLGKQLRQQVTAGA